MKISERDKLIIKWFGLFLVGVTIWMLGISPLQTKLDEMETSKLSLETQKTMAELDIVQESAIQAQEQEAIAQIQTRFDRYTLFESADKLEAYLLPILSSVAIRTDYFGLSPVAVQTPVTTQKPQIEFDYKLKSLVEDYDRIVKTPPTLPTTQSTVLMVQANYVLGLTFEDYQTLLQTIDGLDHALRLSQSSYVFEDSVGELTFDLYMTQKPDFAP